MFPGGSRIPKKVRFRALQIMDATLLGDVWSLEIIFFIVSIMLMMCEF